MTKDNLSEIERHLSEIERLVDRLPTKRGIAATMVAVVIFWSVVYAAFQYLFL